MASRIGIRDLEDNLSAVIKRVRGGEIITVTEHKRPVALLVPFASRDEDAILENLARTGRISWSGGRPRGSRRPPKLPGSPAADAVIEGRR